MIPATSDLPRTRVNPKVYLRATYNPRSKVPSFRCQMFPSKAICPRSSLAAPHPPDMARPHASHPPHWEPSIRSHRSSAPLPAASSWAKA